MTVEYHPAVEGELKAIRDYYEARVPGLGREFIDEFERLVLRIAAAPERWMVLSGDLRRAMLARFPYVIYFLQTHANRLRVTVVKHQRRHPDLGRERR
jgi:plasmid stabilization system protein ParE